MTSFKYPDEILKSINKPIDFSEVWKNTFPAQLLTKELVLRNLQLGGEIPHSYTKYDNVKFLIDKDFISRALEFPKLDESFYRTVYSYFSRNVDEYISLFDEDIIEKYLRNNLNNIEYIPDSLITKELIVSILVDMKSYKVSRAYDFLKFVLKYNIDLLEYVPEQYIDSSLFYDYERWSNKDVPVFIKTMNNKQAAMKILKDRNINQKLINRIRAIKINEA